MIVPADISRKQFATTRLKEGYGQVEVDDFLDRVEVALRTVTSERDRLANENDILRRKLESLSSEAPTTVLPLAPSGSAEKILVAAQKTADAVEADANAEAGQIRAAARADADGVRSTARSEAEAMVSAAESDRQRILNQLTTERTELEENIEVLKSKRSGYKAWLRAALARIEEEEAN